MDYDSFRNTLIQLRMEPHACFVAPHRSKLEPLLGANAPACSLIGNGQRRPILANPDSQGLLRGRRACAAIVSGLHVEFCEERILFVSSSNHLD